MPPTLRVNERNLVTISVARCVGTLTQTVGRLVTDNVKRVARSARPHLER